MELKNKVVIPDFFDEGKHLYADELGWQPNHKTESHSIVSKEIFECFIVGCRMNLSFYYVDNDTFYGLHTEGNPIEFKILHRDKTRPYIDWQCDGDTHDEGQTLYTFSFEDADKIWDTIKIDGKSLEEVLERSYIMCLN